MHLQESAHVQKKTWEGLNLSPVDNSEALHKQEMKAKVEFSNCLLEC